MDKNNNSNNIKSILKENEKKVRCPIHDDVIGKYDIRLGLKNNGFYCRKCKIEYYFTIKQNNIKK